MSEIELKPCPFCGAPATQPEKQSMTGRPVWEIKCGHFCCSRRWDNRKGVIECWNERYSDTTLTQCITELEEERENITEEKEIWRVLAGDRAIALERLGGMETFTTSFAPNKATREWIELEARIDFARSALTTNSKGES